MRKTLEQKFWPKVEKKESCWIWRAALFSNGYGHVVHEGKNMLSHRISWQLHNGVIPEGMLVLHRCDVPACVNPDHLFLGTPRDNMQDMKAKGRDRYLALKGSDHGGAILTERRVKSILRRYKAGETQAAIAESFGVDKSTISNVVRGAGWKHVGERVSRPPRRDGSHNGAAKLTDADVVAMRRLYASKECTQRELALRYGIHHVYVSRIIQRAFWKHI